MHILSLMSGSSLDGLDIGLIKIEENPSFSYEILHAATIEYSENWKKRLSQAYTLSGHELITLDTEYAAWCAEQISNYQAKHPVWKTDAISFHGHTVFHDPAQAYSYQMGNAALLAQRLRKTVVCDFRSQDVASGGQGAPLMAICDELLFEQYHAFVNLGGICNIAAHKADQSIAYDISVCNQLLNHLASQVGLAYDQNGLLAKQGNMDSDFYQFLSSDPYLEASIPKSLDNNYIRTTCLSKISLDTTKVPNRMYTAIHFIAEQIALAAERLILQEIIPSAGARLLFSGGGALNPSLMEHIQTTLATHKVQAIVPNRELIEYKELVLMGLLAYLRLNNKVNVLARYTGGTRDTIAGAIYAG